ncbi:MAG: LON peptidase substrate-binding domain-containing protein [Pyrinomonadaceae bacterium]
MSESSDKVSSLSSLPIFPLPLVLLPNEILPLHIFEPRYRQMLSDIVPSGNFFGITRFEPSEAFVQRPDEGTVGCVAEIRDAEDLGDGRTNIVVNGIIRYNLSSYLDSGTEYLYAKVEFFEDDVSPAENLQPLADSVFSVFERIAKAAFKISGSRGKFPEIPPTDPEKLSFLVTAAFNLENDLKYELLVMTSTAQRLRRLNAILLQSVGQMEESANIHEVSQTNGHSKKKIDLD